MSLTYEPSSEPLHIYTLIVLTTIIVFGGGA